MLTNVCHLALNEAKGLSLLVDNYCRGDDHSARSELFSPNWGTEEPLSFLKQPRRRTYCENNGSLFETGQIISCTKQRNDLRDAETAKKLLNTALSVNFRTFPKQLNGINSCGAFGKTTNHRCRYHRALSGAHCRGSDVKAVSLVTLLRFFSLLLPDLTRKKKEVFTLKLPLNHQK